MRLLYLEQTDSNLQQNNYLCSKWPSSLIRSKLFKQLVLEVLHAVSLTSLTEKTEDTLRISNEHQATVKKTVSLSVSHKIFRPTKDHLHSYTN